MDVGGLGSLVLTLGVDTSGLLVAEQQVTKTAETMKRRMMVLSRDMQMAGRNMTFGLTLPLVAFQKVAMKTFAEFENNITKINGLVGVSTTYTNQWAESMKKMAVEVGKTPLELSNALFFITSAGLRGAEAIDILKESAKAATAGLGDTKVVADLVTSAINAFGKANLSAAEATNTLVATVREGKAMPEDLAKSMGVVLPVAAAIGMEFHEVGAAIAAMTRTGTTAATSAIYLRQILNSLLKPSKQAADGLAQIGLTAARVREMIDKQGLLYALGVIKEATKDNVEILGKIFANLRAYVGVVDIMGKNLADTTAIFDTMKDNTGDLSKAFEVSKNTMYTFNQMAAQLQVVAISLGEAFAKALIPVFQFFIRVIERFVALFEGLPKGVQSLIVVFTALVTVMGPLVWIFGSTLQAAITLKSAFGGLTIATASTVAAQKTMSPVMAATTMSINQLGAALRVITPILMALGAAYVLVMGDIARTERRIHSTTEAYKGLTKEKKAAMIASEEERTRLENLMGIVRSNIASSQDKTEAVRMLNQAMPQYLKNISEEAVLTGEAQKAIDAYLGSLRDSLELKELEDRRTAVNTRRINNLYDTQLSKAQKFYTWLEARSKTAAFLAPGLIAPTQKLFENQYAKIEERRLAIVKDTNDKILQDELNTLDARIKALKDFNIQYALEEMKGLGMVSPGEADMIGATGIMPPSLLKGLDDFKTATKTQQEILEAATTINDEYTASLKTLDILYAVMGDKADYLNEKQKLQKSTLEQLVEATQNQFNPTVLALRDAYNQTTKALDDYTEKIKKHNEFLKDSETLYNNVKKSLESSRGDMLTDKGPKMTLPEFTPAATPRLESYLSFKKIMDETNMQIEKSNILTQLLGSSYGASAEELKILQDGLDQVTELMATTAPNLWTTEMFDWITWAKENIKSLREEAVSFTSVIRELGSVLSSLSSIWDDFFPESKFAAFLQTMGKIVGLVSKFMKLEESITKIKGFLKIATDAETASIATNTAAKVANTIATKSGVAAESANTAATVAQGTAAATAASQNASNAAAKIMSTYGWIPIVGAAIAGGLIALLISSIMRSKKAAGTGMAEGGIVPSGFPNDTFPARLSSREAVIPLDKFPSLINSIMGGRGSQKTVVFQIKGRTLEAILDDQDTYSNIY